LITIIDYGMGNLASVKNALAKLGYEAEITSSREQIRQADKVILPGVGAFGDAIDNIRSLDLEGVIKSAAASGVPFLGICLGLQLLFTESEENGLHQGLDIIPGRVERFNLPSQYKVPQMGWNSLIINPASRLFKGIPGGSYMYFVHSYYVVPRDREVIAAETEYGIKFVSAIEKNNVFATQFHPEKSGRVGLNILRNFGEM